MEEEKIATCQEFGKQPTRGLGPAKIESSIYHLGDTFGLCDSIKLLNEKYDLGIELISEKVSISTVGKRHRPNSGITVLEI